MHLHFEFLRPSLPNELRQPLSIPNHCSLRHPQEQHERRAERNNGRATGLCSELADQRAVILLPVHPRIMLIDQQGLPRREERLQFAPEDVFARTLLPRTHTLHFDPVIGIQEHDRFLREPFQGVPEECIPVRIIGQECFVVRSIGNEPPGADKGNRGRIVPDSKQRVEQIGIAEAVAVRPVEIRSLLPVRTAIVVGEHPQHAGPFTGHPVQRAEESILAVIVDVPKVLVLHAPEIAVKRRPTLLKCQFNTKYSAEIDWR